MKTAEEIKPNYGPVYAAAMYPELCKIFQRNGYALAVHGSLARDFDLIAVPWAENVSKPEKILKEITKRFAVNILNDATEKNHGRVAYTITIGWGECFIDLSFFPNLMI